MVRRSTVERGPHLGEPGLDYESGTEFQGRDQTGRSRPRRTWGGAGGRWLVWLFRGVAWAAVLLIGYRGIVAIVSDESGSGQAAPRPTCARHPRARGRCSREKYGWRAP